MSRSIAASLLIGAAALLMSCVISEPAWLSDNSAFLKALMEKEILSILGIILTITLASAAQLHLELNKIEERCQKKVFIKARSNVHWAAYVLIMTFVASIIIVVAKPIVATTERYQALFNACGLFLLWLNVLVLVDITEAAFAIQPALPREGRDD